MSHFRKDDSNMGRGTHELSYSSLLPCQTKQFDLQEGKRKDNCFARILPLKTKECKENPATEFINPTLTTQKHCQAIVSLKQPVCGEMAAADHG